MRYCEFCGSPIEDGQKCNCEEAQKARAKKRKIQGLLRNKYLVAAVIVVAALLVSSVFFFSNKKYDPFDYTTVTFEGVNGYGFVTVDIDVSALAEKIYGPSCVDDVTNMEDLQELLLYEEKIANFKRGIEYSVDVSENLSNGDQVTVTINAFDDAASFVKSAVKTFTVAGLSKTEGNEDIEGIDKCDEYDIFANINLTFNGLSGEAYAVINNTSDSDVLKYCQLSCVPSVNLKNGDIVTVTVSNVDALLEQYHVTPKEMSKEYTVSGLSCYATSVSQIPQSLIEDYSARYLSETKDENEDDFIFSYKNFAYHSSYLFVAKEDASLISYDNALYIFVSYDRYMDGKFRDTVFIPLIFNNIILASNGELSLPYEDGFTAIFTTDIEAWLADQEEDYNIYKFH